MAVRSRKNRCGGCIRRRRGIAFGIAHGSLVEEKRGGVNCDEDEIEDDDETLKTRIRLEKEREELEQSTRTAQSYDRKTNAQAEELE